MRSEAGRAPRVRIHADDFGSTPAATRTVARLWTEGALDGFSVLANGDALADVAARLAAEPGRAAYIAVHLNLSEGPSSAPAAEVPRLVDGAGRLRHTFGSLAAIGVRGGGAREAVAAEVRHEWREQVRRVAAAVAPRRIDALDGHIHVHALPFLFPVAAALAHEAGVPAVRVPRESFHLAAAPDLLRPWYAVNVAKHFVLRRLSRRAAAVAAAHGLRAPARLVGVLYTGRMTVARMDAGIAAALRDGADEVEVVVHPGRPDPAERARWTGRDAIWADAGSPLRDAERDAVVAYSRRRQST